ncbi:putative homogentisate 1,2-dioxygenase [Fistulina hepatica ATCC 64428]|uniref:homogentisate 1,2-dioxygenase n=1 Tax=Fistulina hepatica ATCC 64428 TaxID=1128425 RepID=A0A0D7ACP6_9AGAR|nr:putative homogentisate 1,2-dioxygenase [Fistulina hepatica ATCC 64428]
MAPSFGSTAQHAFSTTPTAEDPYRYQVGFGNRFASEAIPGTLPFARNTPQKCKYDLYSEQLNGSAFISSRQMLQNVWMYRIRPAVAHRGFTPLDSGDVEGNFSLLNPRVHHVPQQLAWDPFMMPPSSSTSRVDFAHGIHTIAGHGDPTLEEGVAVHIYTANASMQNSAFCSADGDMLILPQEGRLSIQTELGRMMVRPGELVVIQKGIRFKITLPDGGPVRGYIQEIFGSHYELPELGPLGSNGMAHQRDFEMPIASFDIDESPWEIVYKYCGKLYMCKQDHTPFDVVAWHGNYVPYKYLLTKFVNVGNLEKDQMDPTVYCVLTARSKIPGVSLTDFLVFTPRWSVATDTFRPPYYHRNMSTEVMGLLYGTYGGSSHVLEPGGLSYEASFMPHGETYETWKEATTVELKPTRVCENTIAFMFHISMKLGITDYALHRSGVLHASPADQWDNLKGHFMDHIEEINADLCAAGLPTLGSGSPSTTSAAQPATDDQFDNLAGVVALSNSDTSVF